MPLVASSTASLLPAWRKLGTEKFVYISNSLILFYIRLGDFFFFFWSSWKDAIDIPSAQKICSLMQETEEKMENNFHMGANSHESLRQV